SDFVKKFEEKFEVTAAAPVAVAAVGGAAAGGAAEAESEQDEFDVILDFAEVPAHMMPAMFTCGRTAGWCAHILEQKQLGKLVRPAEAFPTGAPTGRTAIPPQSPA
ncbi:citrate/2-methylcitrate synthase, partial [Nocardia cyriacigeorgica]|uniref:citrate/2-methylcitrate synthase n=1 Tax=Nocardia cyriacigeorgica TaxID=135487 RepID=UPI002453AC89